MTPTDGTPPTSTLPFLRGEGAMPAKVRAFDWASTPVGDAETWPSELKTAVGMILESRFPAAIVWGEGLTTIYNDAFRPILGDKPEALGRSFADVWAEVWEDIGPIAPRAFAGEATFIENYALTVERHDGGEPEEAFFTFCYSPLRLADGTVAGMIDTVIETTETVRAERLAQVLNHELGHRLKNTVAMMQSLTWQTLRGIDDQDAAEALMKRVTAMGHAHDLLLASNWLAADLGAVAETVLAPYAEDATRIVRSGPAVTLGPKAVLALSLILHELATNAVKYGALSMPGGQVTLDWAEANGTLTVRWRERGGPAVVAPERRGFGTRLIDMGIGDGKVERRFPAEGAEVDLTSRIASLSE